MRWRADTHAANCVAGGYIVAQEKVLSDMGVGKYDAAAIDDNTASADAAYTDGWVAKNVDQRGARFDVDLLLGFGGLGKFW